MSYYGKKAALEWKYTNECKKRYDNSNSTIKRLILETWYPIGTEITKKEQYYSIIPQIKTYTISGHNPDGSLACAKGQTIHPIEVTPTEAHQKNILREAKLRTLGVG